MRLRRLCLEIFDFRRFFKDPITLADSSKHFRRADATPFSLEFIQSILDKIDMFAWFHFAQNG